MEITELSVSYNRKVQLDDFEPMQHSVTLHAELAEDDDVGEVQHELSERAEDMVEREITRRITQKKLDESDE